MPVGREVETCAEEVTELYGRAAVIGMYCCVDSNKRDSGGGGGGGR